MENVLHGDESVLQHEHHVARGAIYGGRDHAAGFRTSTLADVWTPLRMLRAVPVRCDVTSQPRWSAELKRGETSCCLT